MFVTPSLQSSTCRDLAYSNSKPCLVHSLKDVNLLPMANQEPKGLENCHVGSSAESHARPTLHLR